MRLLLLSCLLPAVTAAILVACSATPTSTQASSSTSTAAQGCSRTTTHTASVQSVQVGPRRVGNAQATRVIVGFKDGTSNRTLDAAGHTLTPGRPLGTGRAGLFVLPTGANLPSTLSALRARPDVAYAEPDDRLYALSVPNDPLYAQQWNLTQVNATGAWALTTGSANTVIAVVDSGILYDSTLTACRHPELAGKVLPGYDFVSDSSSANDGDGRDADPYDPDSGSDDHGSHVAGIAAALTDNGVGIAGLDWAAKILPVRALTAAGGALSDVVDAIEWASGGTVSGVGTNGTPATVINLSLGADGSCPASLQAAISDAVSRGSAVVVAAGNGSARSTTGVDASNTYPADCSGVIAVGATGPSGERAYYSNYGSDVALMAPGGEDQGVLTSATGITSLSYSASTGVFGYALLEGTSMAAPHVSAVVALMKGVNPALTPAQLRSLLVSTATPLSAAACTGSGRGSRSSADCGGGELNAAAAVAAAVTAASTP